MAGWPLLFVSKNLPQWQLNLTIRLCATLVDKPNGSHIQMALFLNSYLFKIVSNKK
jgi:hypothetical protein